MGSHQTKKLVPNRPPPKMPVSGPAPVRMVPKKPKNMVPPDGGWGWMVVFGACLSLFFFPSITIAFGVMFRDHLEAMGAGATEFTAIANGLSIVWSFSALFMPPLAELFGARSITILGGLLAFLTLTLVAFSKSIVSFTLVYSFIGGMASAFCAFFGIVLIPRYFDKRKGLANGFVVSFSALGKIVMAPLLRLLLDHYGYMWTCLLAGALSLHTCVSGMLYHPSEWHLIPDPSESETDEVQLRPRLSRQVTITENGIVENQKDAAEAEQTARSSSTASQRRSKFEDEEDENVIYVMPTTPQTDQSLHKDDEVVLFSRAAEAHTKEESQKLKIKIIRMDSVASLVGSHPWLTPVEEKNSYFSETDDKAESCWDQCLVVKVFRMLDYALLREPYFHLIAWPNAIVIAGYINYMYALPGYITSLGFSNYQSAFAISVFSVTEVVIRMSLAFLSDYSWFPAEPVYISGFVFASLSAGLLTVVPTYEWILVCVVIKSVAMSVLQVVAIHVILKYLSADRYAQVIGFFSLLNGIMMISIGTLAGFAREYTGSYPVTFYWIAVTSGISAVIWITWRCYKTFEGKYKKVPAHSA